MTGKEERFIFEFETGKSFPQEFFDAIMKAAFDYKYGDQKEGMVILSDKEITDAIFCLSDKDSVVFLGKSLDGQTLSELFIASIYLKYLDALHPNKRLLITVPLRAESYDLVIYASEEGASPSVEDEKRGKLSKYSQAHYIQIKEEFDYKASTENYKVLKEEMDLASLEDKASRYTELVLIFIRDYCVCDMKQLKEFMTANERVGLIHMPSFAQMEIPVTGGDGRGPIVLEKGKYNFLLTSGEQTAHIKYNTPSFLTPRP